jgi:hypothetical protein
VTRASTRDGDDDSEFVPTQARNGAVRWRSLVQQAGNGLEDLVSSLMTARIVDLFEAVEIDPALGSKNHQT